MGSVYVAFDPLLNRKIAIKILRISEETGELDAPIARSRMLREAQAMAMCGHPNLVQVFDVGTYDNDVFIAMEFVEGVTLREWLDTHDPTDWRTILKKYLDAARGIAAAHSRNLIHRDFKPENVMVDKDGHVRVMDFGLTRHTGGEDAKNVMGTPLALAHALTQTGTIMGTPAYMAPEQFLADNTDARTDQFAFCVALFEGLYGYRPYSGTTMRELAKSVMVGEVDLPSRKHPVPEYLLTGILKGLQTESFERHDSMDALIETLKVKADFSEQQPPWLLYGTALAVSAIGMLFYGGPVRQANASFDKTPSQATVPGVFMSDTMTRVLAKHQEDIEDCVDHGRERDPDLAGYVDLGFEIHAVEGDLERGNVKKVLLEDTDLSDRRTARCILGMSMTWDFPAPACVESRGIECVGGIKAKIEIPEASELPR